MRTVSIVICAMATCAMGAENPATVPLWSGVVPGAQGVEDSDRPDYTVYPAASPVGTGVIVFPGGGYQMLAMDHEGRQVALWLNGYGITAFVLKYRLGPKYHHPIELNDALRAVRTVRAHAAEYRINPGRIGIWGFSAGGHLAATVSTHFDAGNAASADPIERVSSRPDFAILAYPVISFGEYAHKGSLGNLLGDHPDPKLIENLSNEKRVTTQTPPTFLFHTTDDAVVPVQNSLLYFEALCKVGVPAELHVFEHGAHGVGLAPYDPTLAGWTKLLEAWMRGHGWLARAER